MARRIRIYLVYAEEDYRFRDKLVKQVEAVKLPIDFSDMPNKQPWVPRWKTTARTRAFECDAAIVFITGKTKQGAGVKFELECVNETQVPVLGVYGEKCDTASALPDELRDARVIDWNWPDIAGFLQSLGKSAADASGRA